MKILQLTGSVSRSAGGLFESVRCLSEALDGHGAHCNVVGLHDRHAPDDLPAWGRLPVTAAPVVGPRLFGYSPVMVRQAASVQADVVMLHGIWEYSSIVARRLAEQGARLIVHPHGMLDPWAVRNSGWKKRLAMIAYQRRCFQRTDVFRALNPQEADAVREFGLRNEVAVVPNGVTLPPIGSVSSARAARQGGGRLRQLLFVARLHPKKGLEGLIKAWQSDARIAAGWRLAIAGWGTPAYEAEIARLVAAAPESANIRLVGPVHGAEKDRIFRESDAFVLPSFSEGLPIGVLEAWSYGLPVVMSRECNLDVGFDHGCAIQGGPDIDSLVAALRRLIDLSDTGLAEMGDAGRRLCEASYGWDMVASQILDVCRWTRGLGPRPATLV